MATSGVLTIHFSSGISPWVRVLPLGDDDSRQVHAVVSMWMGRKHVSTDIGMTSYLREGLSLDHDAG